MSATAPMTAYDRVIDALAAAGMKSNANGTMWTCPAHDDRNPSLGVKAGDKGALVKCYGGCELSDIAKALNMHVTDLFDKPLSRVKTESAARSTPVISKVAKTKIKPKPIASVEEEPKPWTGAMHATVEDAVKAYLRSITGAKFVETYPYVVGREIVYHVVRFALPPGKDGKPGKDFRPVSREGSGWKQSMEGVQSVPYKLPELLAAIKAGKLIHIVEGEKDVNACTKAGAIATTNPGGANKSIDEYIEHFEGAESVRIVADKDESGAGLKHAKAWAKALEGVAKSIEIVEAVDGKDAADALAAGYSLEDAFRPVEADDQGEPEPDERSKLIERFSPSLTSVSYVFESRPPPREMLVHNFMIAKETGMLVARGGAGKGHFQQNLALSLATGTAFAGFEVPKPRGVVLVSAEDDREEMHRRILAAIEARYGGDLTPSDLDELRDRLMRHLRIVDLRGVTGGGLGQELRELILRVVEAVENPGLIMLDPLARLLPADAESGYLNSQEGAGRVLNELDALRDATGCSVIAAHHVNKASIREGGELQAGSPSGSQLLADLSRWVLSMKPLTAKEAEEYGLTHGHYVEAAVTKTNYTPPLDVPLIFRRVAGGALSHVKTKSKAELVDETMLALLHRAGEWMTREQWREAAKESDVGRDAADHSRSRLKMNGLIDMVEVREGKKSRQVFAPSKMARLEKWPAPPKTIAAVDGYEEPTS